MSIEAITFQVFPAGLIERRILYTALNHRGQRYTHMVQTTDQTYNPRDHTAAIQAKIERRLAREEIDIWMEVPRRTPSFEYATRVDYQARIDERKTELQGELDTRQTEQDAIRDNEGKVA